MLLRILCCLPVLLTIVSSQGVPKESAGCQYDYYAQKSAKDAESVKTVNNIKSFDACLTECANHNGAITGTDAKKCNAIALSNVTSVCFISYLPPDKLQNNTRFETADTDTAIIKKCTGAPATPMPSYTGCGKPDIDYMPELKNNLRIIGGSEAKKNSWPWMLDFSSGFQGCGGSLLPVRDDLDSSDMVLTISSCLARLPFVFQPVVSAVITAGSHEKSKGEPTEVKRRLSDVKHLDGLAVVLLDEPIKFSKVIRPICLPSASDPLPINLTCVATGWGGNASSSLSDEVDPRSVRLQQTVLNILPDETCRKILENPNSSPQFSCAGKGAATICKGDVGSPVVCRGKDDTWTQYGIIAAGLYDVCDKGTNTTPVYRIQHSADWIRSSIKEMSVLLKK